MVRSSAMGEWVPLMDYAMKKGVSLSTLRRYIKANKVLYRVENGRYLLFVETDAGSDLAVAQLQTKLEKAQEEIVELKTLIAFYEESLGIGTSSSSHPSANRFDG